MNPCACRDCMELATVPGSLCWECEQSECAPYPTTPFIRDAVQSSGAGHAYDCQRDAYSLPYDTDHDYIDRAGDRIPHPRVWPNYIDNPE